MTTTPTPLLDVADLRVGFGDQEVVRGVSLRILPGECVAIVGESGSGKSVTARALLGMAGANARTSARHLRLRGRELGSATEREWRAVRGRDAGLILQDALVSLDPLRPIGREIEDPLRLHGRIPPAERRARVLALLASVGMPDPALAARQRSGELSGGLRQRALIAAALALDPPLLIADEPTTALDVSVQARILALLADIRSRGTGLLLISHDLAVVGGLADRILVMRDGEIVEEGTRDEVLGAPTSAYTQQLIAAVPSGTPRGVPLVVADRERVPPTTDAAASVDARGASALPTRPALLRLDGVSKAYRRPDGVVFRAVDAVSLALHPGETLGLVGESGSGKTTLARLALALEAPDAGEVILDGAPWSRMSERARRRMRHRIGAIYQDALSSFDPRWSVGRILSDALPVRSDTGVAELLDQVGLAASVATRKPLTLSGGQRQRVSIARALAASPEILICDEPVSALDVTIQAQILDLIDGIQRERGLACLFISHDLSVVRHMSDRVAVMRAGRILESGDAEQVFADPEHAYTAQLVADSPRLVR